MTKKTATKAKPKPAKSTKPHAPNKKKEQVCIACKESSPMETLHIAKYPDRKITRYRCACGQVQIRNVSISKK